MTLRYYVAKYPWGLAACALGLWVIANLLRSCSTGSANEGDLSVVQSFFAATILLVTVAIPVFQNIIAGPLRGKASDYMRTRVASLSVVVPAVFLGLTSAVCVSVDLARHDSVAQPSVWFAWVCFVAVLLFSVIIVIDLQDLQLPPRALKRIGDFELFWSIPRSLCSSYAKAKWASLTTKRADLDLGLGASMQERQAETLQLCRKDEVVSDVNLAVWSLLKKWVLLRDRPPGPVDPAPSRATGQARRHVLVASLGMGDAAVNFPAGYRPGVGDTLLGRLSVRKASRKRPAEETGVEPIVSEYRAEIEWSLRNGNDDLAMRYLDQATSFMAELLDMCDMPDENLALVQGGFLQGDAFEPWERMLVKLAESCIRLPDLRDTFSRRLIFVPYRLLRSLAQSLPVSLRRRVLGLMRIMFYALLRAESRE